MSASQPLTMAQLRDATSQQGLSLVGVAAIEPLPIEAARLRAWQDRGYAGDMAFMQRDPDLFADPRRLLPEAKSVVMFAATYESAPAAVCPPGFGRVARYAWGRDYHRVLKKKLRSLLAHLAGQRKAEIKARIFTDAVPFLERAYAVRAQLGFIGKNTLLIRPRLGSLFFLAEVVWDVEIEQEAAVASTSHCGSCVRCQTHCPTGALKEDYILDARRCISYLTIEKEGMLSAWERTALGDWIFGCDRCQEVCPFNHRALSGKGSGALAQFSPREGAGAFLSLSQVLQIRRDQDFLAQFAGTPLMRPGREGLLRNAAVVATNTGAESCRPFLERCVMEDGSEIVRAHALAALADLGGVPRSLITRAEHDGSGLVQSELRRILGRYE